MRKITNAETFEQLLQEYSHGDPTIALRDSDDMWAEQREYLRWREKVEHGKLLASIIKLHGWTGGYFRNEKRAEKWLQDYHQEIKDCERFLEGEKENDKNKRLLANYRQSS